MGIYTFLLKLSRVKKGNGNMKLSQNVLAAEVS